MIDTEHDDEGYTSAKSTSWIRVVDHGGLVHVHGKVHTLFTNIERVVQRHLRLPKNTSKLEPNLKEIITTDIVKDENVLLSWANVGIELAEADKMELFSMIVNLFITIRGVSFVGGCIEIYKQSNKKSLRSEKALWTKFSTSSESAKAAVNDILYIIIIR